MSSSPPRFVIADPSLTDARGHHFALTERITRSIRHHGFQPVWLCHRDAPPDLTEKAVVEPALAVSLYDAYRAPASQRLLPRRLQRPARAFKAKVKDGLKRFNVIQGPTPPHRRLASDLAGAIDRLALSAEDRLLFHTTDGLTYAAIDLLCRERSPEGLPKIHLCTPYDPEGIMPNRVADHPIDACIGRWRDADLLGQRLFLYAENALLADHLATLWQTAVHPLELPAIEADPKAVRMPDWPESWRPDRLKVVHLGPARAEKGFCLLPDIIQTALKAEGEAACFAIQCSPQIIGYTPAIAETIARLKSFPAATVRLLEDTLDEAGYLGWLASADAVLLPYGVREYRKRSSGIVSEALSLGKVIVATSDTYPASMIDDGAGMIGETADELGRAIATIAVCKGDFLVRAAAAGHRYTQRNDPLHYVTKCIEAETVK